MKTFKEWLGEGKLNKESIMHNGRPSRDINFTPIKNADTVKIWLNGGTAYEIKMNPAIVEKMRNEFYDNESELMKKYVEKLALDVAEFIEKEVTKWEKDFK